MKSISLLLASGFSAPMGYPTGNKLNELLRLFDKQKFHFRHGRLSLITSPDDRNDDHDPDKIQLAFCQTMINYFTYWKKNFDYEDFFDFMKEAALKDTPARQFAEKAMKRDIDYDQLVYSFDQVYIQLIDFYLKDKNGETHYDQKPFYLGSPLEGYSGFYDLLKYLSENYTINVHTLNHDLLFERFNQSDCLNGELCDGFEELGSPYYGKLVFENEGYKVRLEKYSGNYNTKVRLYKLHGSRNYGVFNTAKNYVSMPDSYYKTRYHIGFTDIYKEHWGNKRKPIYEKDFEKYYPDILTGTTSKILRYDEPLLYKKLFKCFQKNLTDAELLIIIGYGAKDEEINKMLVGNFEFRNKKSFIIDPLPGEKVQELRHKLNSKLVDKPLENLCQSDIEV